MKRSMPIEALPHDLDAEIAILGGCLIYPKYIPHVANLLEPSDFYRDSHQDICRAIFELKEKSDLITVREWLQRKGLFGKSGGKGYLASLMDAVSTGAGYKYHAEIVRDLSRRRRLITQCQKTMDKAYSLTEDLDEILSDHKAGVRGIHAHQKADYHQNKELIQEVFKDIEARAQSGNHFVGIRTGFENIDKNTNGLEPKTTTYLIARPSMGKTALALNTADKVALNYSGKVLFFSLESGDKALTRRRLAAHSGVYLSRIRMGDIEDSQWRDLVKAANVLSENNLIIIDGPRYKTIDRLASMADTLAMEYPLSLIVIDHIQRMRAKKKTQNRNLELSFISEELSSLANSLDVPILILCQLSRDVEKRAKRRQKPQLSDMKESGDLEANADMVWGLYRKDRVAEYAELECLKGRDTGIWKTWLKFDRFTQKFSDCEEQYESSTKVERGYDG